MKTNVYIDAFNLYYGCLKGTRFRWLDVVRLSQRLLKTHDIVAVRYFTAIVKDQPHKLGQAQRQLTYIRALETLPGVSIHRGHYLSHVVSARLAHPPANGTPYVRVIKTEEKGSDVNLASYLLRDAFKGEFEQALVISNDSDLVEPVKLVQQELGLPVGIARPCSNRGRRPSVQLKDAAKFVRDIQRSLLKASQLPETIVDAQGTIQRPPRWA